MHDILMGFSALPEPEDGRPDFLPGASSMRMAVLGEQGGELGVVGQAREGGVGLELA